MKKVIDLNLNSNVMLVIINKLNITVVVHRVTKITFDLLLTIFHGQQNIFLQISHREKKE
jgi:hypothetical protein